MKPLEKLINTEKARLLHELFPQEIPALLEYTSNLCAAIKEDKHLHSQWKNGLLTLEAWLSFVNEVEKKIKQCGNYLHTNSRVFADQLFDGYLAFYMVHSLTLYTTTRRFSNHKFISAVNLLFNP